MEFSISLSFFTFLFLQSFSLFFNINGLPVPLKFTWKNGENRLQVSDVFISLLSGRRKQTTSVRFFFPSLRSDQSLSRVQLFATPWITACQASMSITNSRSSPKLTCIESVMPSGHLILCPPLLLLPPIPPSIRVVPMSQLFSWGGQSIAVSALASVFPVNTQDWSPLGWTRWTSLQTKGLSRVFSNTTVQKHQFFSAQLSSQSNSHIHTWPQEKP